MTKSDWQVNIVQDFSYASKVADNAEFGENAINIMEVSLRPKSNSLIFGLKINTNKSKQSLEKDQLFAITDFWDKILKVKVEIYSK